ncbi:hypothetical protein FACS1894216_08920 [Synergistales bacterium]|nr:hypothetical protein FACS1894216_08920 [Synergistales bacterium]
MTGARRLISRILGVKSSRGVSFTLSFLSALSKPFGYLRILIIAWLFGASAIMDAFQLALGVISLFAGSIGGSMQSAVLPELERVRKETGSAGKCRSLLAFSAWCAILMTAILCAALFIAPGVMIRTFAGGVRRRAHTIRRLHDMVAVALRGCYNDSSDRRGVGALHREICSVGRQLAPL